MEKNLQLSTEPEKLMAWLDNNDLLLTLDEKEAKVLLGYLEGHGYAIGINDGKWCVWIFVMRITNMKIIALMSLLIQRASGIMTL